MSFAEAKRDILPALTQLSLSRLRLPIGQIFSRASLRFTGRSDSNRSVVPKESHHGLYILFALPCLRKLMCPMATH